jgi:hypothetical protein
MKRKIILSPERRFLEKHVTKLSFALDLLESHRFWSVESQLNFLMKKNKKLKYCKHKELAILTGRARESVSRYMSKHYPRREE